MSVCLYVWVSVHTQLPSSSSAGGTASPSGVCVPFKKSQPSAQSAAIADVSSRLWGAKTQQLQAEKRHVSLGELDTGEFSDAIRFIDDFPGEPCF